MKVLLTKDVKGKGRAGTVVTVSDSYARNVLIPKEFGVEATAAALNDYRVKKKHEEKAAAEKLDSARKLSEELKRKMVVIPIKIGEGGRAFGSVSSKEIAEAIKEQLGLDLDRKKIVLDSPIKEPGVYEIPIRVHPMVDVKVKVEVTKQ